MPRLITALCLLAALVVAAAPALSAPGSGDATEEWLVQDLNRARWDPVGYGAETGADTSGLAPRPPLAINADLASSADAKAADMTLLGYFGHASPPASMWPNEFVRAAGYHLPQWWSDDGNYVESIYGGPVPTAGTFAGSGAHRDHVFGQSDFFARHREIGVGSDGTNWVVHTAHRDQGRLWVTGAAFDDTDGDGVMDLGEGLSGVTVTLDGSATVTTGPGGLYSIEVTLGSHQIVASGKGVEASGSFQVTGDNVGADFVKGDGSAVIRRYALCRGKEPTIIGTEGPDRLVGTKGPDVIHGMGGDDVIIGLRGDDIICGGPGNDRILGRAGDDRLFGEGGDDLIRGGAGEDLVKGGSGDDTIVGQRDADRLLGGGGADVVRGSAGDDVVVGGPGFDRLLGSRGDDRIRGRAGDDVLVGGDGVDVLNGDAGTDRCRLGETVLGCEM